MGIKLNISTVKIGFESFSWSSYWKILKLGLIWYRREINTAGGYFVLYYSSDAGVTWDTLLTLNLTEENPVIDLTHQYRHRIVGTEYRVDRTLTAIGYAGAENTDWENIYST